MADYKVVDATQLDADLTIVADAIRSKGGTTEQLSFPQGMKQAVEAIQSGGGNGGNNELNLIHYMATLGSAFSGATFETGTEIEIFLGKNRDSAISVNGLNYAFSQAFGMKRVKFECKAQETAVSANRMFSFNGGTCVLETVDFTNWKAPITDCKLMFAWRTKLKEVLGELDVSNSATFQSAFLVCQSLETIRFKANTIKVNIDLGACLKLSNESVQSIISGLATVETTQTLKFHADVKAKLTDEQIAIITGKNWTLA